VDPLYAYNKTTSPLALPGTSVTLPASFAAGRRALTGSNVTAELSAFTPVQFAALQALVNSNSVEFIWPTSPAFATPGLTTTVAEDYVAQGDFDIFLSPSGDDSNQGTSTSKIKTIEEYYKRRPTGGRGDLKAHFDAGVFTLLNTGLASNSQTIGRKASPEGWLGTLSDQVGTRTATAGAGAGSLIDTTLGAAQFRSGIAASVAAVIGSGQGRYVTITGMAGLVPRDSGPVNATILVDPGTASPLPALQISSTVGFAPEGGVVYVSLPGGGMEAIDYQATGTFNGNPALLTCTRGILGTTNAAHAVGEVVSHGGGKKFLFSLATSVSSVNQGATSVTFSAPDAAGTQLLSGMTGGSFTAASVGMFVRVRGAANAVNNSELRQVTNFVSATSVRVFNPLGVPEGPTGGVSWAECALPSSATGNNGHLRCISVNGAGTAMVVLNPHGIVENTGLIAWQDSYRGAFARLTTPTTATMIAKASLLNNQFFQFANGNNTSAFINALINARNRVAGFELPNYRGEFKIDGTYSQTPGFRTIDISALVTAADVASATAADINAAAIGVTAVAVGAVITLTATTGNGFVNGITSNNLSIVFVNHGPQQAIPVESHGVAATGSATVVPVASLVDNDHFFIPDGTNPGVNLIFNVSGGGFTPTFAGDALTGSLTFTGGSAAVTGSGTLFTQQVLPGDWVYLDADGTAAYRKVLSVTSDTALTLTAVYGGAGGTGASHVGRVVDVSALPFSTAADVGVAIMSKVNAIHPLTLRVRANTNNTNLATATQTAVVNFENMVTGSSGNVPLSKAVANASFAVTGFTGGVGAPTNTFTLVGAFNAAGYGAVGAGSLFVIEQPATIFLVPAGPTNIYSSITYSGIQFLFVNSALCIFSNSLPTFERVDIAGNGLLTLVSTFYSTFGAQNFLGFLNSTNNPFPQGGNATARFNLSNATWNHQFYAHIQGAIAVVDCCTVNTQARAFINITAAAEKTTFNFLQNGTMGQAMTLRGNGCFSPADVALVQFNQASNANMGLGGVCSIKNSNGYGVLVDGGSQVRLGNISGSGSAKAGLKVDRVPPAQIDIAGTTTVTGNQADFEIGRAAPLPNWRSYASIRTADGNNVKGYQDQYLNRVNA
jgi:hypothetical protein